MRRCAFVVALCLSTAVTVGAAQPKATPADQLKVRPGFQVELLHSVPRDQQGSWVSMTPDPQGRLIVCDQYGGLFRVTPPPVGKKTPVQVEKIDVDLGEAQGLLWAFDSLYVMVNTGGKYKSGLYRVTDSNGDGNLDTVKTLKLLKGRGEHGPHAVLLSPDGKSLTVVCGNGTKLPEIDSSRVPQVWDEDLILPRIYGRGFMRGVPPPGGFIAQIDPEGKTWELLAVGFRNEYDAAFNKHGELFAYDADMEWDMNTPWYRPTRVVHAVSGAEFGWRNGSGKWPAYYPDSVPAVVNVGPGSPTGVTFGYGAKFPAKYQEALFICDWSYGKLYAVHLTPQESSYTGNLEDFITATPLPLTDIVINPTDGAMYFCIGGRKTTSGLYRVTYVGDQPTEPVAVTADDGTDARGLRRELETFHGRQDPKAIEMAWPHLGSDDRMIRWAARIAVEHQPVASWQEKALAESHPRRFLNALLALVRHADKSMQPRVFAALERLNWKDLSSPEKLTLLRVYQIALARMGRPDKETVEELIAGLDRYYPAETGKINAELCQLLVYLQSPTAASKTIALLEKAPTQEEQIHYAKSLRNLTVGWTPEDRRTYFRWFSRAAAYRGGASFEKFVDYIKKDALKTLTAEQKNALKPILEAKPQATGQIVGETSRPFVKDWKMEDFGDELASKLTAGRNFQRGRSMFAITKCFACHRFNQEGGAVGPDLTAVNGRFSPRDLLESILVPSKAISDQYQAVTILMTNGKLVTGRIVNHSGDTFVINTDMLNPDALTRVNRNQIDEMEPSRVSMMPAGLLNTLTEEEILDLLAYMLSRGNPDCRVFATSQ